MRSLILLGFLLLFIFNIPWLATAQTEEIPAGTVAVDWWEFEMVYVPAGTVEMGIPYEVAETFCEEYADSYNACMRKFESVGAFDTYSVGLDGFWIDKYEMTIAQFEQFWEKCVPHSFNPNESIQQREPQLVSNPQQPQVYIDWFIAIQLCNCRLARLPTEAEWEYAASGSGNTIYPWGNDFDKEHDEDFFVFGRTYPMGTMPANVSWVGAYDMAGNAAEWTEDRFDNHDVNRVIRGGSWGEDIYSRTSFFRDSQMASTKSTLLGVRCARTSDPRDD